MAQLKIYNAGSIQKFLSLRAGETKWGEKINFISALHELKKNPSPFVIFGIPEDIGIRANHGNPGASKAWEACLPALLNVQENHFFNPSSLLLLGEIDCSEEMKKAGNLEISDPNYYQKMGELVEKIDEAVSSTVKTIVLAGKIPIIIGGGHNNAYGNIKGSSEALKNQINVLNIDAHTDLRQLEHRHSGNGFSYARKNGFLNKYCIFGLHESYTPQTIFDEMDASDEIKYHVLDNFLIDHKPRVFQESVEFVNSEKFGLEVDCDAIANFPSSAISPSGFTLNEVRSFVKIAAKDKNCAYLHLCEAIPKENYPTGKALSYLITDFLKTKAK
ncbi:MAG TPA: formimidoylglutamase [Salinimicrobium sp.]|nr:formimidoylglutamase [Salinimicrobium sp.]